MKRNKLMSVFVAMIGLLVLVIVTFLVLLFTRVKWEYNVKEGEEISADVFRRYNWDKGNFVWIDQPETTTPGKKKAKIQVFPVVYKVTVIVEQEKTPDTAQDVVQNGEEVPDKPKATEPPKITDTVAPVVITKDVSIFVGRGEQAVTAEQFIDSVEDSSECSVEYETIPSLSNYGKQTVSLIVKDAAGNITKAESALYIVNCKESIVSELGAGIPTADDFLVLPGSEISVTTDLSGINVMTEGSYEVSLIIDGVEVTSVLQIKDTKAPILVLRAAETWLNKPIDVNKFIDFDKTADNSDAFEAFFVTEPDWSLSGEQNVTITATDAAGNSVNETTTLTIKKDEKPPIVTVTDIDVQVGGTVSYKKAVSYYDDIDSKDEMKLSIERSGVNLNEVGTYEVIYTVTDCSGNSTSRTGKVNVLKEEPKWEDEEAIHEKAQKVLNSILKDGMTDREKAKAIYKWVKSNVGYIDHSEKGNYTRGAYEGLFKKQGDCFVFASTAKELLTMAGIPNIDIVKSTTNPSHYWNLVYIEDGWYHFDSTPRYDKSEFFLLTDAELEAYSSTHRNTHIFDRSLYPEIK